MFVFRRPIGRAVSMLLAAAIVGASAHAKAQSAPASQSAGESVRDELSALRARLEELEKQHSAQREHDQARISELESQIRDLQGRVDGAEEAAIEAARLEALSAQAAALRQAIAGTPAPQSAPLLPSSQPGSAEDELDSLLAGAAPAAASGAASRPSGLLGTLQGAVQSFNPDISLNGDMLAQFATREGGKIDDEFIFRELEIGFAGAIDPYTRADVIATIAREDDEYKIDLEEAYLTFLQLPYGLQARAGQFRADFGRANGIHVHALPWPDYPFVIQRFFGEEGLLGAGGELSWAIPNPWGQYFSLSYEFFNNDNDVIFAGEQSDDFTHLVRAKTFRDLSSESTLEFGGSFATAPNDAGHGSHRSMIEGLDLTYRWKPKGEGLYKSVLWQNEVLFSQADIRGGQESTWGMYSALEYQFARRWKVGTRLDNTQLPFSSSNFERGYSAYLTFLQSEFLFWRLAYTAIDRDFYEDGNRNDNRFMLQINFTLGAHPAHKY